MRARALREGLLWRVWGTCARSAVTSGGAPPVGAVMSVGEESGGV